MRKIVFMIAAILIAARLMAADTADFKIEAYRIDPTRYLNIDIVDALSDRLQTNPSEIDVTDYLERFMGKVEQQDKEMSMFSEHIVFAYRVAGNQAGTYTITLSFEPFYLDGSQSEFIAAAYEIGNVSYTYTETGSSSYTADGTNYSISEIDHKDTRIVLDSANETGTFMKKWSVTDGSRSEWITRGSVAMDVGPTTYATAPYGKYGSTVTIRLESGT